MKNFFNRLPNKDIRCIICDSEFTFEETKIMGNCLKCGTKNSPAYIKHDVEVQINWQELRIICNWADNWARQCSQNDSTSEERLLVGAIVSRLQEQHSNQTPLTITAEAVKIKQKTGINISTFDESDEKIN